jgi:hypothetical protein
MDLELARPLAALEGLDGYDMLKAVVRLHGTPLGYLRVPVTRGRVPASLLADEIETQFGWDITKELLYNCLATPRPDDLRFEHLEEDRPSIDSGPMPLVTVAVCLETARSTSNAVLTR